VSDASIRIPSDVCDRLAEIAATEGLPLRAYLARLADTLLTPAERHARAENARAVLRDWNGYDPTEAEQAHLDAELNRRLSPAVARLQSSQVCTQPVLAVMIGAQARIGTQNL
jgi:hypothetical protein